MSKQRHVLMLVFDIEAYVVLLALEQCMSFQGLEGEVERFDDMLVFSFLRQ